MTRILSLLRRFIAWLNEPEPFPRCKNCGCTLWRTIGGLTACAFCGRVRK